MSREIYIWKKAPFIRILFPLINGIIMQWHAPLSRVTWFIILAIGVLLIISFSYFSVFQKFRYKILGGVATLISFTALGALLVWFQDIRNADYALAKKQPEHATFIATLSETPVEKTKSFKANAMVSCFVFNNIRFPTNGKIIIYFRKDSLLPPANGSRIIFKKPLQSIKNSGNPGSFDYERYSLFQGITHQVFLESLDWVILPGNNKEWLPSFVEKIRVAVLRILRTYIKSEKELGLAEALLIGYKNDLDKSLVQSYSNTGVVHIIAISGLHLGLIYWLLVILLRPLQKRKHGRWLRPVTIITGLWLFSLLAGAQPSILRSAVMFSCIVLGECTKRKTSVFNTLSLSAFGLLCYNPFWLWDLGFQLSYSAVLSIVIFMRPVYDIFYIKNKLLDMLWQMSAVTLAAQILTTPVSIYHFHQFPILFLFTNFIAVPLSSVILLAEILLCAISFFPWLSLQLGAVIGWLIRHMNNYIEKTEGINFSLWQGLQINTCQVILLYLFIAGCSYWLLEKSKKGLTTAMLALMAFFVLRGYSFWQASAQQKLIVYNISKYQAIDFMDGRKLVFRGDPELQKDDFLQNFHLKSSRTRHRIQPAEKTNRILEKNCFVRLGGRTIMMLDSTIYFSSPRPITIDVLVLSKNPDLRFSQLNKTFGIRRVVFDGSVPAWKLRNWKKDCDSLLIPHHDVKEKGAFVMNLN